MAIKGLRKRSITALFFGAIVLSLILINNTTGILLMGLIGAGCAIEYDTVSSGKNRIVLILGLFLISFGIYFYYNWPELPSYLLFIPFISHIVLVFFLFDEGARFPHHQYSLPLLLLYLLLPVLTMSNHIWNNSDGKTLLLFTILLIWISDTGAYLGGNLMGKNKLMSRVSPNKTIEGLLSAGFLCCMAGIAIYFYQDSRTIWWWISFSAMIWIVGSVGDLIQSAIKRKYSVKDSGNILPGHGGVWDRFDSFVMVIPYVLIWVNF